MSKIEDVVKELKALEINIEVCADSIEEIKWALKDYEIDKIEKLIRTASNYLEEARAWIMQRDNQNAL